MFKIHLFRSLRFLVAYGINMNKDFFETSTFKNKTEEGKHK